MNPPIIEQSTPKTRTSIATLVISASALVGIAVNEGYVGQTYKDVVGVPTIGFGETQGVKPGQTTTPPQALRKLLESADKSATGIKQCITVPISQGEYDAYLSLSYNIGVGAFCGSGLVKKLNAQDYTGACQEILKWNRAGGVVQSGLTKRRYEEFNTCMGGA
ncbi:lysozyme [Polynucleobacter paneuropaeus]|nr:lysozyme [Polynucleobacter paneuropaeus]